MLKKISILLVISLLGVFLVDCKKKKDDNNQKLGLLALFMMKQQSDAAAAASNTITISGSVMGPGTIKNAKVTVATVKNNTCVKNSTGDVATILGATLATTTTGSDGKYTVSYSRQNNVVCVVVTPNVSADGKTVSSKISMLPRGSKTAIDQDWSGKVYLDAIIAEGSGSKVVGNVSTLSRIASRRFTGKKAKAAKEIRESGISQESYLSMRRQAMRATSSKPITEYDLEKTNMKAILGGFANLASKVDTSDEDVNGDGTPDNIGSANDVEKVTDGIEEDFADGSFNGDSVDANGNTISVPPIRKEGDKSSADVLSFDEDFLADDFTEGVEEYAADDDTIPDNTISDGDLTPEDSSTTTTTASSSRAYRDAMYRSTLSLQVQADMDDAQKSGEEVVTAFSKPTTETTTPVPGTTPGVVYNAVDSEKTERTATTDESTSDFKIFVNKSLNAGSVTFSGLDATKDVYVVFTNVSKTDQKFDSASITVSTADATNGTPSASILDSGKIQAKVYNYPAKVVASRSNPPKMVRLAPYLRIVDNRQTATEPMCTRTFSVGDTYSWKEDYQDKPAPIPTRLRGQRKITVGSKEMNVRFWVSDSIWTDAKIGDTSAHKKLNQEKIDIGLDYFVGVEDSNKAGYSTGLTPAKKPSHYALVKAFVGDEWGTHSISNLMSSDAKHVDVVFFDMVNEGSRPGATTLGYYGSYNSYKADSEGNASSNEALVFFMNAAVFGEGNSEDTWLITHNQPAEQIGTLNHEFQHMINFYQKKVVRGVDADAFQNEMAAMVIEDVTASYTGGNAGLGPAKKSGDRMASFAKSMNWNMTFWGSKTTIPADTSDQSNSYAHAYTLGGFLVRQLGPDFLSFLVQSKTTALDGVDYALQTLKAGYTHREALRRLGVSMVLSPANGATIPKNYKWSEWTGTYSGYAVDIMEASPFNFGAVSATAGTASTPKYYSEMPASIRGYSNLIWKKTAGSDSLTITVPENVYATVVQWLK